MEMEDQLTPTQIKIIAGWSHKYNFIMSNNNNFIQNNAICQSFRNNNWILSQIAQ